MAETKGHCEHGEFDLTEGCAQCIAERRQAGITPAQDELEDGLNSQGLTLAKKQLVKVRYFSESTGEISDRQYTYCSEDVLKVGDIVSVPVRDHMTKAKVSAVDVDESEVAAFKDKVKTIPARAKPEPEPTHIPEDTNVLPSDEVFETAPEPEPEIDTKINLCDTCISGPAYPMCPIEEAFYGDGKGNDNIIQCKGYQVAARFRPAVEVETTPDQAELEAGLNQEGLTLKGAVALRPGEDIEARGYYDQAVIALEYAKSRTIATSEDLISATNDLVIIATLSKAMDAKKKDLIAPLRNQADAIRETYSTLMDPIIAADKITRGKMAAYDAEQKRLRTEQEDINKLKMETARKEAALSGTGEITESVNLVEVAPKTGPVVAELGTSGMTAHWKYEVFDFTQLPDAYKVADNSQLTAIARKHHDQKPVPGVRFYNEPSITVRRP